MDYSMVPTDEKVEAEPQQPDKNQKRKKWRNLAAYWVLGLCNNYGYVVMLVAAKDILKEQEGSTDSVPVSAYTNATDPSTIRNCNILSTGAVLLADILPSLIIKFIAPFLPFYVSIRVGICILLASGGFLVVAFSTGQWMSILGVVLTSLSSGLGEVTYLQYSSFYDKNVVSTWSSGTGGAGIFGALSYAALNKLGFRNALLIMLIVPVVMAVTFWFILLPPEKTEGQFDQEEINQEEIKDPTGALMKKIHKVPRLLKYMIPLALVYLFEYFINQGMFELVQFEDIFIDSDEQYRWLQVDYQIGVFLSRSSVNVYHVKRIWLLAVFQLANVFLFTSEAIFLFIPSFWIVLALTLWEGLLGGAAYVNTFYKISYEVPEEDRQFSMGVTSFSDAIGITFAGVFSLLAHNAICELPNPQRL